MPKVSVIIPTYNSAQYIAEAIESVLAQTYKDYEIIVVDDGSIDNTREVLKPFMDKIIYVYKENGGQASARNLGIKMSKGEYIAFLDSDDIWLPQKLELQVELLDSRPEVGLVYSDNYRFTDDEGIIGLGSQRVQGLSGMVFNSLFLKNFIPTLTVMVRRKCLDDVGLFDESKHIVHSEDYDLWLRIAKKYEIAYIDKPLAKYRYRYHRKDGFNKEIIDRAYMATMEVIKKNIHNLEGNESERRKLIKQRMANLFFEWGYTHFYFQVDLKKARKLFLKSMHYRFLIRSMVYYLATFLNPLITASIWKIRG